MPLKMANSIYDLTLVLGPDGATKVPACSQVMSSASHVFNTMLSGRFTEGRSLSVFAPEDLHLPEDDARSLQIVIRVLHHQTKEVPINMTRDEILSVAKVVDKYDLCAALKWAAKCWLRSCKRDCLDACAALALAAYLLGEETAFQKYTKALVLDYVWTVGTLLNIMGHEAMPPQALLRIVVEMESQRAGAYERLADALHSLPGRFCDLDCVVAQDIMESIQSSIRSTTKQEPFPGLQVVSIREALQGMRHANIPDKRFPSNHDHLESSDLMALIKSTISATENTCRGVCLRCVHEDGDLSAVCTEHVEM